MCLNAVAEGRFRKTVGFFLKLTTNKSSRVLQYNTAMKIVSLQSGSNGNSIYIETESVRLLVDAGISGRQAQQRLQQLGRDIQDVDAVLISHDHRDHARCVGIYQRKFGLPIFVTRRTLDAICRKTDVGRLSDVRFFAPGETLRLDGVAVESLPTPHDGADGVAFVVDDGRCRLGVLTDLGSVFAGLAATLADLDGVILESNYDPDLLANGSYPYHLKRRIRGAGGHLSNFEAADLLSDAASERLQWACLAHLSEENNRPELAMRTHREVLGDRLELFLASRYRASQVLEL
jgi:phosphoribosyl 1,2-cyclic phosphodiesterase